MPKNKKTVAKGPRKLWGGRFKEATAQSVNEFTSSIGFEGRLLKYDILASVAHAKALYKTRVLSGKELKRIAKGLTEIAKQIDSGKIKLKQELEDNKKIGDFCKMTYGVEFPMMSKTAVRGSDVNPFYKQLIAKTGTTPKWNFYKYVIAPRGEKVTAFSSMTKPDSTAIMKEIKPYLK